VTWDNRDLHKPFGPDGRARPGGTLFNRELSPLAPVYYPPARPDVRGYGPGIIPGSFPRQQSKTATLAASTAFQEVVRFSGRPDRIDLHTSAIGVEFQYRNRGSDAVPGPVLRATGSYEADASFEIVEARDPAGAGGQLVTVTGYWKAESTTD
jgi:hypothetical protein